MTEDQILRIALLHYGDVRNFGDVLFPLLTAQQLRKRLAGVAIDFVSPTGIGPEPASRFDAARLAGNDAIVLAGGELVHRYDRVLSAIYQRFGLEAIEKPTDLVFGWSHLRGPYKAWLGLGVPMQDRAAAPAIANASRNLDMVVVRGTGSARRLREAGGTGTVGADIGWLFSELVPDGSTPAAAYVVVQALPMGVPDELEVIVEPLKRLERRGFEIVLLPLSTCWEDEKALARIAAASSRFRLVDYQTPVLVKLRMLANCAMYIGQSMHGFIATLATGHPAGLCFPIGDDKFSELLADNQVEDLRVPAWDQLPMLIDRLLSMPPERVQRIAGHAQAKASDSFDHLASNILAHREARIRTEGGQTILRS